MEAEKKAAEDAAAKAAADEAAAAASAKELQSKQEEVVDIVNEATDGAAPEETDSADKFKAFLFNATMG